MTVECWGDASGRISAEVNPALSLTPRGSFGRLRLAPKRSASANKKRLNPRP